VIDLRWPWLAALLGAALVLLLLLWLRRSGTPPGALLVAHTERLRRIARYRSLARRQVVLTGLRTAGALVLVAGAILLAARPVRVEVTDPDRSARDIQLCLDVSGSMFEANKQIIGEFRELVDQLSGERIGLTIFDADAVTVFPLTDDYEYMGDRLDEAAAALEAPDDYSYFVGTVPIVRIQGQLLPEPSRTSQIGDGLVSCMQRFDAPDDDRGRAVVLASDNEPFGPSLFTLEEAVGKALRDGVVVYGIGPADLAGKPARAAELRSSVTATGGTLSLLDEETDVDQVVDGIQRLERARLEQAPRATEIEDPAPALSLASGGLVLLLCASLVGRRR
jgi:Ca-activated chloride channel homolog